MILREESGGAVDVGRRTIGDRAGTTMRYKTLNHQIKLVASNSFRVSSSRYDNGIHRFPRSFEKKNAFYVVLIAICLE